MQLIKILSLGLLAFGSVTLAAVPAHAKYKSSPFALAGSRSQLASLKGSVAEPHDECL